ncbi:MAG TPA: Na+/H+ antiporter subunit E [Acidimicrobiales bacterium]|nr:Na+/H+ antiporter subunit E [Acidimicrobiales bacterium]
MSVRRTTIVQFLVLFAFWYALSGRNEPLFLVTGAITAAVVTAVTHRIAGECLRPDLDHLPVGQLPLAFVRSIGFVGWMAGRIFVASLQLARLTLTPKLELDPCTLRFHTELRSPLARTTLANAISLVPGTLTVDIDGAELVVHALTPSQAGDLVTGELQNRIAKVFLDRPQPPVDPSVIQRERRR